MNFQDYILENLIKGEQRTRQMFSIFPNIKQADVQNLVKELVGKGYIQHQTISQWPIIKGITPQGLQYLQNKQNNACKTK